MTGRLWTAPLELAGVFAVHGLQCAADGGHGATHAPAASVEVTASSTGHADALGIVVLLLVLLVPVLHLTGNSIGGPGSHVGSAPWDMRWP